MRKVNLFFALAIILANRVYASSLFNDMRGIVNNGDTTVSTLKKSPFIFFKEDEEEDFTEELNSPSVVENSFVPGQNIITTFNDQRSNLFGLFGSLLNGGRINIPFTIIMNSQMLNSENAVFGIITIAGYYTNLNYRLDLLLHLENEVHLDLRRAIITNNLNNMSEDNLQNLLMLTTYRDNPAVFFLEERDNNTAIVRVLFNSLRNSDLIREIFLENDHLFENRSIDTNNLNTDNLEDCITLYESNDTTSGRTRFEFLLMGNRRASSRDLLCLMALAQCLDENGENDVKERIKNNFYWY